LTTLIRRFILSLWNEGLKERRDRMGRKVTISVTLSEDISDELLLEAEEKAREAAVIALQQEGLLTIREAAQLLGLSYEGYLDLLARKGLPATADEIDPQTLLKLAREARG